MLIKLAVILSLLVSFVSTKSWADTALGISSVALPGIAEERSIGVLVEKFQVFDEAFLGFVHQASMDFMFYPALKLEPASEVVIENNEARLERGNALEIADKHISMLHLGPKIESCWIRQSLCFGVSPLAFSFFANQNTLRSDFAPLLSIRVKEKGWFARLELSSFLDRNVKSTFSEESSFLSVGMTLY